MYPNVAMPAAMLTMFCSAMPTLKNRSGWRRSKSTVRFEYFRSAVSTTIARIAVGEVGQHLARDEGAVELLGVARSQLAGSDGVGSDDTARAQLPLQLSAASPRRRTGPGSRDAMCARAPCS